MPNISRKNLKHSIRFGDGTLDAGGRFAGFDTWEDWHLIPASRPTIAMPGVETKFVTIPGMDGSYDLSNFLRKDRPAYGDRSGTFEFYVDNESEFWMTIYPKIVNSLHGKKFKMVLNEDDPDYYWEGRFTVDKYEAGDGAYSTVSISYAVGPFKRKIRKNSQHMVWDNFNFEKDYDHDPLGLHGLNIPTGANYSTNIWGDGAPFQIEVTPGSTDMTVTFGGETKVCTAGVTTKVGHAVYGLNPLTIVGHGTVSIDWRGGGL